MKHTIVKRADLPLRPPPRWMVSSHYWPAIELREEQAQYEITRSFDEIELLTAGIQGEVGYPNK